MRKLLLSLGVAAVAVGALTSCGDKNAKQYTQEDKNFGDSISVAIGEYFGAQQQQQFDRMLANMPEADRAKINKADFLAGVKAVLDADTSKLAYFYGLQCGMQLAGQTMSIAQSGYYPINTKKVYEAFKNVYMQDSLADAQQYFMNAQNVMSQYQKLAAEKEMAKIRESKEFRENGEAGAAYAKQKVAEGYTQAPSGIVYKIENPGTGEKIQPSDKVAIFYKGMKIDGTVFDQTQDKPYESSASVFVPGFNEALSMLAKGGKMTVVIPAELAYKETGAGDIIGPNETLVFDIEVADVTPRTPATPAVPGVTPAN